MKFDISKVLLIVSGLGGVSGIGINSALSSRSLQIEKDLSALSGQNETIEKIKTSSNKEGEKQAEKRDKIPIIKNSLEKTDSEKEELEVKKICPKGQFEKTLSPDGKSIYYSCSAVTIND